ncbi:MAG: hypothetical protein NC344_08430 [Bacteroidales bacterium]|nr:hypothetical protein [Bacteroidales bacterium]MCM1147836.1 hypothetical protein [Bacteroidales bacterium]MCM1206484.1 hypothetical protein [Bacillota bacterium]MCM1510370.1 hypothetical protein [Clostridium sp.]
MKKVYVTPEIHIIAIEPEEILAATGPNGWNVDPGDGKEPPPPGFGGNTGGGEGDDDNPTGSLSKDDLWDDTFIY